MKKRARNSGPEIYKRSSNPLIVRLLAQVGTFHYGVAVTSQILCISITLNKRNNTILNFQIFYLYIHPLAWVVKCFPIL